MFLFVDDRATLVQAELSYIMDNVDGDDGEPDNLQAAIFFTEDNTTTICPASMIRDGTRAEQSVVMVDWHDGQSWEGTILKISGK